MDAAAQVLAHIRPSRLWFAEQLARGSIDPVPPGTTCPGGVSSTRAVIVPRAPSRPDRRYPIGIATTGSCARPRSSVPLALRSTVQSVQVAASPCWNQVLPDVISAHPSRRAWTPTPAARGVHLPVSSPTTSAFPPLGQGRRQQDPCSDFSTVAISGLQSFSYVQARRFAGHPGRSYRCAIAQGSRDFLRPSLSWFVTSPRPGYACRPNRATDGRGLSPHKMRSLVGCSPNE